MATSNRGLRMKFCLIFIFAIPCINFCDACSCAMFPGWELTTYCESQFAGTFKVTGPAVPIGGMQIHYPIAVVQQFRGATVWPTIVETNDNSAACGVTLNVGSTYFIATNPSVDGNTLSIYMCGLLQDWTSKTCCEMIAEAKKYNCKNIKPPIQIDPPKSI